MVASIRGHQGLFKIFENGSLVNLLHFTSIDVNMDSSFSRTAYIGAAELEGDQVIEGWSGSGDMEVKDSEADTFIDNLIANNLNGVGVSDYTFITTENYPDGTSSSYVYYDVQWKLGRSAKGSKDKITKKLEFQAAGRKKI